MQRLLRSSTSPKGVPPLFWSFFCCGSCKNRVFIPSDHATFDIVHPSLPIAETVLGVKPSFSTQRFFTTGRASDPILQSQEDECRDDEDDAVEWEEEVESEPKIGDGGDGGGVVFGDLPWGARVHSIANEALLRCKQDMTIFSFKATHRGYIYVRLDKLSNKYGCPSIDEIETFHSLYKEMLDQEGALGNVPNDLAVEVSSPGAERILKVPEDLERFKKLPMLVTYIRQDSDTSDQQQVGIFVLESIEAESGHCTWKLANVRENRDVLGKGRPLGRKQKEWRLRLRFEHLKQAKLFLEC